MANVTLTLEINPEELSKIRNVLNSLQGTDAMNDDLAEVIEGVLTLTDTIKDALDEQSKEPEEETDEYTSEDDSTCPVCGCDCIEGGSIETDSNIMWQECSCSCGATWNNTYKFTCVDDVNKG